MATFISTEKFERWWRKVQAWFATQFASINIDISDLAKQGTNQSATNTAILTAVENIDIDTSDLAKEATLGTPATGQPSTIFAAIAAIGSSEEMFRVAMINKLNAAGVYVPQDATLLQIISVLDEYTTLLEAGTKFAAGADITTLGDAVVYGINNLKRLYAPNATSIDTKVVGAELISVDIPNMTQIISGNAAQPSLPVSVKYLKCPKLSTPQYGIYYSNQGQLRHFICNKNGSKLLSNLRGSCIDLYDFYTEEQITTDFYFANSSSNAINRNLNTLTDRDEWDDPNEPVDGFNNNLEKFLWYFEYHFIPIFATVTENRVITLNTYVFNVVNVAYSKEQPTKTLIELLTDRGWQVASVS